MTKIIDGKKISQELKGNIVYDIAKIKNKHPRLDVILVGNNPESKIYVGRKKFACEDVGIICNTHNFESSITQLELINKIKELNDNKNVHGILVQLPLPKHIDSSVVLLSVSPNKDVDGLHPYNLGKLFIGANCFVPCTSLGCIALIKQNIKHLEGKNAVIVGRSNLVGKPTAALLLKESSTVTIAHSKTKDLKQYTRIADILVVAIGQPRLIGKDYIKPGSTVIDVGINKLDNGEIVGDVNFEEALGIAEAITPVPGGVGPMTVHFLLKNVIKACKES